MDIKLEKRPWYIRYRYRIMGIILLLALIIYVMVLAAGPRKLRVKLDDIQVSVAENADFMEYVDVEGIVQPIMTIIVNTRESGNVTPHCCRRRTAYEAGRHNTDSCKSGSYERNRRPAR